MMRRRVVIPALLLASLAGTPTFAAAQYGGVKLPATDATQRFTAEQLDNLTGPIALYPDALLAQVLVAATFPDQVEDAASFVKANGTDNVDAQSWDVSVKAVAHYPSALNTLADKIDWTAALGKAYAMQSSDVMSSVQRLRKMAADQGNLASTPQQNVVSSNDTYQIVPVEPRVIYVPVYDPYVIYSRPIFNAGFSSRWFSFGVGFPIGDWLIYDCDWGYRRVYYNGWSPSYYGFGGGWRQRSRPFINVTNIYVNTRYRNVFVNRNVVTRNVNYYNVDRYASVHGGRHFEGRRDGRYDRDDRTVYANRRDGEGQGAAVQGEGYRNGASNRYGNQTGPTRGSSNGNNNSGNGNRPGSMRDGSGYGNDVGGRANEPVNTARPRAPEQRRSEPAVRPDQQQIIEPARRAEPRALPENRTVYVPQTRRAEPRTERPMGNQEQAVVPQRRSEPVQEARTAPQSRAEPRSAQPRAEQPREERRSAQPTVVRPDRPRGNESTPTPPAAGRSARPRGGN
ncbi:MAG: DUF3300 domain-containing protein [Phycisphaerae bacterium]|nr:DUF3300 domain-containing protein [Gemmatimonadaceae bacterium]